MAHSLVDALFPLPPMTPTHFARLLRPGAAAGGDDEGVYSTKGFDMALQSPLSLFMEVNSYRYQEESSHLMEMDRPVLSSDASGGWDESLSSGRSSCEVNCADPSTLAVRREGDEYDTSDLTSLASLDWEEEHRQEEKMDEREYNRHIKQRRRSKRLQAQTFIKPAPRKLPSLAFVLHSKQRHGRRFPRTSTSSQLPVLGRVPVGQHESHFKYSQAEYDRRLSECVTGMNKRGDMAHPLTIHICAAPHCGRQFRRGEHLRRHVRSLHSDVKRIKSFPFTICHV